MSSTRNKVKEFFGILAKVRKSEEFFGFLGDRTGNVVADDYSNVWVLLYNGQVVLARNKVAPIVPRTPVAVGYTADDPKLLQVLRVLNVHDRSTTPYLPPHAKTHTWPGADTLPIRAEQFLPGLALPSGGMVVQYYGWPYKISSTWHLANHSTHDFTSHIPTVGAKWVGVEIDADGVITYNESSAKDSRDLLTPEDIAVTPSDRRLLFAVKVYLGQSEVIKNELDTDLFDPRFTTSDGGGGGGGSVESVTGDGVDNTDPANPVISYPTPADIGADVAGAAAAAQTAAESYADSLVVGLWDDRGTYNASGGAYPSSGGSGSGGAIKKGDIWTVSVAGTLPTSQAVEVGDTVRALVDGATNTQADWAIGQNNIGYVAENSANKATSMTGNETSNVFYLTAKAVYDWAITTFIMHSSSTAANDFLVGSGTGAWIKKTLAQTITILRTSLDSAYAALSHTHAATDITSGTLAAARLPAPTTSALGGVQRNAGSAGQYVTGIDSAGALTYDTPAGGREILNSARTYYVRTDGNDSNSGLANTSGGAFLTIQKAVDTIALLDINAKIVTVQVADGTYTGAVTLKNVIGYAAQGNLVIQGNAGTPTNVVVSVTSNNAFSANGLYSCWDIKNMKITTTTSGNCIFSRYGSVIRFSGIDFGACAGNHISGQVGGMSIILGSYTVSGNASAHYQSSSNGFVGQAGAYTMTLTANVSITTWASVTTTGILSVTGATYTLGAFTMTGKKYDVSLNGVVFSAVTMPGTVAGTTATGGQYV